MKPETRIELKKSTERLGRAVTLGDKISIGRDMTNISNIYTNEFQSKIKNVWDEERYKVNVAKFAVHKSINLLEELKIANRDLTPEEFIEALKGIDARYNDNWLQTELDTITSRMEIDQTFEDYAAAAEEDPNVLVCWNVSADETTCEECNELDGICLPYDDEFWDENTPGCIHCNCRCYTTLEYDKEKSDRPVIDAEDKEKNITEPRGSGKIFKI